MQLTNHTSRVSVSSINNDSINTSSNKCLCAFHCISSHTNTSSNTKTTLLVLTCHWLILGFGNIFISNQTNEMVLTVDYWQFLNLILLQNLRSCSKISLLMSCYKVLLGHHIVNEFIQMTLKTKVTVGNNTHKMILLIYYRNTTDMVVCQHLKCILHCTTLKDSNRIVNHTILSSLHNSHLACLVFDTHILMNHTDTTFTRNRNRHRTLCNGVHSCCNERHIKINVT